MQPYVKLKCEPKEQYALKEEKIIIPVSGNGDIVDVEQVGHKVSFFYLITMYRPVYSPSLSPKEERHLV